MQAQKMMDEQTEQKNKAIADLEAEKRRIELEVQTLKVDTNAFFFCLFFLLLLSSLSEQTRRHLLLAAIVFALLLSRSFFDDTVVIQSHRLLAKGATKLAVMSYRLAPDCSR
jgi:hypothetical protein